MDGGATTIRSARTRPWAINRQRRKSSSRPSPRGRLCNPDQRPRPRWLSAPQCTNIATGPVDGGRSASAGDGRQFRSGRHMAAWLGLVPRQHSTGGKNTLLGISRRGNDYLRRLLIHGARSCVMHLDRSRDRLGGRDQRTSKKNARKQGHCRAGSEGRTSRKGNPQSAGRELRTS